MATQEQHYTFSQERLREISWEIGAKFARPFQGNRLVFAMIVPRRGYLHWHIDETSVRELRGAKGDAFHGASMVIRVYDVTEIVFNGYNAHTFFDIGINTLSGNYYLNVDRVERNLLAEFGFRLRDNSFHALARSNSEFFDRERASGKYQVGGLFVGKDFSPIFPVENLFDAPVYEKMQHVLKDVKKQPPLALAVVFAGPALNIPLNGPLGTFISQIGERCQKFGGDVQVFTAEEKPIPTSPDDVLLTGIDDCSEVLFARLAAAHKKTPFQLVHCHDWYSSRVGLQAATRLNLPMVLTLHSTEHERTHGSVMPPISVRICEWEKEAVDAAQLVIVPHSSTRQQVMSLYGANPEKILIIPDVFEDSRSALPDSGDLKKSLGFHPAWPMAMFAGEIAHAAGADLLVDALIQVCRAKPEPQFVFAGEGPLKGELEGRVWHAGLAHRCKFVGDVPRDYFERLLLASDFAVIPARTWQDEGFAQMAISFGKPVLTTHQSHINCVAHGQNGLVTYDNPGSIVWGINEMLANPLQSHILRLVAKRSAVRTKSLERAAVEHYMAYQNLLNYSRKHF